MLGAVGDTGTARSGVPTLEQPATAIKAALATAILRVRRFMSPTLGRC
jgi:hypothetical protein